MEVKRLGIARGEAVAITGSSGTGKSTLLELLGLVLPPRGARLFRWQDAEPAPAADIAALWRQRADAQLSRIRARSIGFVLQSGGLLPYLDVEGNVTLNRRLLGLPPAGPLIDHLLRALEIDHLRAKQPRQLSIGERQRVSIARALAHQPALLLADEPTAALDPVLAGRVMQLMLELVHELGSAAVIATHDAERLCSLGIREVRAMTVGGQDRRATRFAD